VFSVAGEGLAKKKSSREISSEINDEIKTIKQVIQDSIHDPQSGMKLAKSFAVLAQYEKMPELLNIWVTHAEEIDWKALQASVFLCGPRDENDLCAQARKNHENIKKFAIKYRLFKFK